MEYLDKGYDYLNKYEDIYDHFTFENLMERMLERIDDKLDKREGSIIWDALAPAALELEALYIELDYILRNSFATAADREWLVERARERDIHPKEASSSLIKAKFNREIPLGHRFNYEKINFFVSQFLEDKDGEYFYKLTCEQVGKMGNVYSGKLTPIDFISNLNKAEIVELLIPGEDEEDTEDFRKRYFEEIKRNDYGGNISDYKKKVKSIKGIGGLKVYPVWNGGGTVKLVIINSEFKSPTKEMVGEVQEIMDPIPKHQLGLGVAPIGHYVTVEAVKEEKINIKLNLTFSQGKSYSILEEKIKGEINTYFLELAKNWENKEALIVRVSQLESRLLSIEGIEDIEKTLINNSLENYKLDKDSIPILGDVT